MEAWDGKAADRVEAPAPEARYELAQGRKPWEYDRTKSPSPSGATHFSSMPREAKFNPSGKPRLRVRPSGSERTKEPRVAPYGASDLRGDTVPRASALG